MIAYNLLHLFCSFTVPAYTTLDRLHAVLFQYRTNNNSYIFSPSQSNPTMRSVQVPSASLPPALDRHLRRIARNIVLVSEIPGE